MIYSELESKENKLVLDIIVFMFGFIVWIGVGARVSVAGQKRQWRGWRVEGDI